MIDPPKNPRLLRRPTGCVCWECVCGGSALIAYELRSLDRRASLDRHQRLQSSWVGAAATDERQSSTSFYASFCSNGSVQKSIENGVTAMEEQGRTGYRLTGHGQSGGCKGTGADGMSVGRRENKGKSCDH